MTAKLDPRSARKHLQFFRFADLFVEDLGWSYGLRLRLMSRPSPSTRTS